MVYLTLDWNLKLQISAKDNLLVSISKIVCHSEGAFAATEESLLSLPEILRFAQDDILEMNII
jgi:hypothetical protein